MKKTILSLIIVLLVAMFGFAKDMSVAMRNYHTMSLIGEINLDHKIFLLRQNIYQLGAILVLIEDLLAYRMDRGPEYYYAPLDGNAWVVKKSQEPGELDFDNNSSFALGKQFAKMYSTMTIDAYGRLKFAFYTMIKKIASTGVYANDMTIDQKAFQHGVEYEAKVSGFDLL